MQQSNNINSLTIITTTYNSSRTISSFLKSLSTSSDLGLVKEIIIIDNNSVDKEATKKCIISWKNLLNIKYINLSSNIGFARSSNLGAQSASTKYLLFINPDVKLYHKSIPRLVNHAISENADIIGGISTSAKKIIHRTVVRKPTLLVGLFEFSNLGKILKIKKGTEYFYYGDLGDIYHRNADLLVDAVSGSFLMIKTKVFEKLSGFDENFFMYLEDVDLGIRANAAGFKVVFCPHSMVRHLGGASSQNKDRIHHQAWFNSRRYYFRKHFSHITNMIIQPIYVLEEFILKKIRKL